MLAKATRHNMRAAREQLGSFPWFGIKGMWEGREECSGEEEEEEEEEEGRFPGYI